jgi:uncharacterized membrane protein
MLKVQPFASAAVVLITLLASVFSFFFGLQNIVLSLEEWKNSWIVISILAGWLIICMFFAIYTSERCIYSIKMHLNEASQPK